MLLAPPRLKPPPPRPPPPPPPRPPPRASASWTVKAARLTKALSIAMLKILPRILLSLERCELDALRVGVRYEREFRIGESGVHLPSKPTDEGGPSRIAAIDNHQLARQWLRPLVDPHLPVDVGLPESVMIGRNAV